MISSFAQQWANNVGGTTWAVEGKTSYYYLFNNVKKYGYLNKNRSDNYPIAGQESFWKVFTNNLKFRNK